MSIESAKAFIERMKTDEEFATQVASQKDKEERMKFVSEQGFHFTEQEVQHVAKQLSDDDLEWVEGGLDLGRHPNCHWMPWFCDQSDFALIR